MGRGHCCCGHTAGGMLLMCVCLMPEAFYKKGCKDRAPQEYTSLSRGYNQPKIRSAYKSMMSVCEERLDSTKIGQEQKLIQITIKIK